MAWLSGAPALEPLLKVCLGKGGPDLPALRLEASELVGCPPVTQVAPWMLALPVPVSLGSSPPFSFGERPSSVPLAPGRTVASCHLNFGPHPPTPGGQADTLLPEGLALEQRDRARVEQPLRSTPWFPLRPLFTFLLLLLVNQLRGRLFDTSWHLRKVPE